MVGYQWDDADFSGTISTGAMLVPTGEILAHVL